MILFQQMVLVTKVESTELNQLLFTSYQNIFPLDLLKSYVTPEMRHREKKYIYIIIFFFAPYCNLAGTVLHFLFYDIALATDFLSNHPWI